MRKILIGLLFLSTGLSAQTFDFSCGIMAMPGGVILDGVAFNPIANKGILIIPNNFAPNAIVLAIADMFEFGDYKIYHVDPPRRNYVNWRAIRIAKYRGRITDNIPVYTWWATGGTVKVLGRDWGPLQIDLNMDNLFSDPTPWNPKEDVIASTKADWIIQLSPGNTQTVPEDIYDVSYQSFNGRILFPNLELNQSYRFSISNNRNLFRPVSSAPYVSQVNAVNNGYTAAPGHLLTTSTGSITVDMHTRISHGLITYDDTTNSRVEFSYIENFTQPRAGEWSPWADAFNKNEKHFAYINTRNGGERSRMRISEVINGAFERYNVEFFNVIAGKYYNYHSIYSANGIFEFTSSENLNNDADTRGAITPSWAEVVNGQIINIYFYENGIARSSAGFWDGTRLEAYRNSEIQVQLYSGVLSVYTQVDSLPNDFN